jgi:hypothetical protein
MILQTTKEQSSVREQKNPTQKRKKERKGEKKNGNNTGTGLRTN